MNALFKGKKVTVVGLGKTGLSCVSFLLQQEANVCVMDTRKNPPGLNQLDKSITVYTGGLELEALLNTDLIVLSPGLSLKTPAIQQAIQTGVEVVGDIELFCRMADKPIVAITGSNGKSTVTELITAMGEVAGLSVGMGGNIGIPALSLLNQGHDIYVLELSSFQLETTYSLQATAATVLNISEDHLNRYDSLEDYRQAKLKIYKNCQVAVVNADDPLTKANKEDLATVQKMVSFGVANGNYHLQKENDKTYLIANGIKVLDCADMQLTGQHNYLNALAAIALAQAVDISMIGIQQALKTFSGLAHRFQLVQQKNGVTWINDSKATNVGSTIAALTGLEVKGNLHLLLGGDGKGADFSELYPLLNQPNIFCYCFGQDGKELASLSQQSVYIPTMEEAVNILKNKLNEGDVVLLSPACASLDQFKSFEERGEIFTQLAKSIVV